MKTIRVEELWQLLEMVIIRQAVLSKVLSFFH